MVITNIQLKMEKIVREDKEMFFSEKINNPKIQELQHYLKYNIEHWKLVTQRNMNKKTLKHIQENLLNKVPIIVRNNPKKIYEIEKKIAKLIKNNVNPITLDYHIKKLRKYSYDSYIKTNIKSLSKNPKKYHKCL